MSTITKTLMYRVLQECKEPLAALRVLERVLHYLKAVPKTIVRDVMQILEVGVQVGQFEKIGELYQINRFWGGPTWAHMDNAGLQREAQPTEVDAENVSSAADQTDDNQMSSSTTIEDTPHLQLLPISEVTPTADFLNLAETNASVRDCEGLGTDSEALLDTPLIGQPPEVEASLEVAAIGPSEGSDIKGRSDDVSGDVLVEKAFIDPPPEALMQIEPPSVASIQMEPKEQLTLQIPAATSVLMVVSMLAPQSAPLDAAPDSIDAETKNPLTATIGDVEIVSNVTDRIGCGELTENHKLDKELGEVSETELACGQEGEMNCHVHIAD